LGPWAFREAFYFFSGPRGYLSPTEATKARSISTLSLSLSQTVT
jgi:hypothetical protein